MWHIHFVVSLQPRRSDFSRKCITPTWTLSAGFASIYWKVLWRAWQYNLWCFGCPYVGTIALLCTLFPALLFTPSITSIMLCGVYYVYSVAHPFAFADKWSPALQVRTVLLSIQVFLVMVCSQTYWWCCATFFPDCYQLIDRLPLPSDSRNLVGCLSLLKVKLGYVFLTVLILLLATSLPLLVLNNNSTARRWRALVSNAWSSTYRISVSVMFQGDRITIPDPEDFLGVAASWLWCFQWVRITGWSYRVSRT